MTEKWLIKKTVNAYKCLRCDHEWIPRVSMEELEGTIQDKPRICPSCKSAYWDTERKKKGTGQKATSQPSVKHSKRREAKTPSLGG